MPPLAAEGEDLTAAEGEELIGSSNRFDKDPDGLWTYWFLGPAGAGRFGVVAKGDAGVERLVGGRFQKCCSAVF